MGDVLEVSSAILGSRSARLHRKKRQSRKSRGWTDGQKKGMAGNTDTSFFAEFYISTLLCVQILP
jgi:hypothetical protein